MILATKKNRAPFHTNHEAAFAAQEIPVQHFGMNAIWCRKVNPWAGTACVGRLVTDGDQVVGAGEPCPRGCSVQLGGHQFLQHLER